jgi:phosphatidylserine/phosphatidylglycerophosphate/cardiolipin synthase-like enzyme
MASDDSQPAGGLTPIVEPGRNCWRIERAGRATVVVDAAAYFHFVREAMEAAEHRILLIGWDFDVRTPLEPDDHGRGETLGQFMLRIAKAKSSRDIAILKWSFGALKQWVRPSAAIMLIRWARTRSIRYRFDSAHPAGCSHHQKIVVIDDNFAVCGGIDMSSARWDTCDHDDEQPGRRLPNGNPYPPWHDATMLLDGSAAGALAELGRDRWHRATGKKMVAVGPCPEHWPDDIPAMFTDVDIAITRTRAAWQDVEEIREIEALYIDMIAAARHFIYFENQYLTSGKIAAAIAARMAEEDPPEIVVVMPRTADGWLEQRAMDAARVRLARAIGKVDCRNRFRIYVPVTAGGADIYVHAKVAVLDDRLLRVGSSNMNNRSLGLDSECDVVIDAALPANAGCGPRIADIRTRLMAEHLGVDGEHVASVFAETGSLIATIDRLNGAGRHLDLLDLEKPGPLDKFIADNELLDPEHADGFLEPLERRSIWKSWREGRKRLRVRMKRRR